MEPITELQEFREPGQPPRIEHDHHLVGVPPAEEIPSADRAD
jgi:hypothetical protein